MTVKCFSCFYPVCELHTCMHGVEEYVSQCSDVSLHNKEGNALWDNKLHHDGTCYDIIIM